MKIFPFQWIWLLIAVCYLTKFAWKKGNYSIQGCSSDIKTFRNRHEMFRSQLLCLSLHSQKCSHVDESYVYLFKRRHFCFYHVYDNVWEVLNSVQPLRAHSGGIFDSSINALADISRPILWWQCINSSIVLYVFDRYQMDVIPIANIYIQNLSLNTLRQG